MSGEPHHYPRPPSAQSMSRPESPRRPTGPLDPIQRPPRPPSASSLRPPASPRSPSPPSPLPHEHSHALLSPPSHSALEASMFPWLQQNMPAAVHNGVTSWCSTNAEPLLGGFLDGWMTMNATQLLQNEIRKVVEPLQGELRELKLALHLQEEKTESLQNELNQLKQQHQSSSFSAPSSNSNEPAPFTPTLPFAISSPASASGLPPTSTSSSGLGFQRKSSAGMHRPAMSGGPIDEDGVAAPMDVKQLLRNRMSSGNPFGVNGGLAGELRVGGSISDPRSPLGTALASSPSYPGPGEEVVGERNSFARAADAAAINAPIPGGVASASVANVQPVNKRISIGLGGLGGSAGGVGVAANKARNKPVGPVDIIVVEDLGVAQKIAHAALTRGHYKVDVAGDGLAAIDLFKKNMGGLKAVLMDIHLPGISGIETTERIRQIEIENGLPPVYIYGLTGDVGADDLERYKRCGMNGCILKGKLLADAVKQAMEESQNGVEFVNLCDKQEGRSSGSPTIATTSIAGLQLNSSPSSISSASSSASSSSAPLSPTDSSLSNSPPTSAGPTLSPSEKASALEKIRLESANNPSSSMFGTPRAAVPRQLMMDKYQGRGQVKPGVGLPGAGAASTPTQSTTLPLDRTLPGGPNMLLVEDVRVSQKIASQALQRASYKVIAADNGEMAVDKYKQYSSTLRYIIMDINLPGISGIEATEQIRALESRIGSEEALLIFGLTGNVDPESMKNYERVGMNGCILKGKVLADAVKQAIEESATGKFVNIS